jgi:hypothetical protein
MPTTLFIKMKHKKIHFQDFAMFKKIVLNFEVWAKHPHSYFLSH